MDRAEKGRGREDDVMMSRDDASVQDARSQRRERAPSLAFYIHGRIVRPLAQIVLALHLEKMTMAPKTFERRAVTNA